MSSERVDDDRPRARDERRALVPRRAGVRARRPRRCRRRGRRRPSVVVVPEPRPVGRAGPTIRTSSRTPALRRSSTCGRSPTTPPGHVPGAISVPVSRLVVRDEGGVRARPGRADRAPRALREEALAAAWGLWKVGMLDAGRLRAVTSCDRDARRRSTSPSSSGCSSRGRPARRRARDDRARRRLHPRLAQHPVPPPPQALLRLARAREAGRDRVRERRPRGDRRVAAAARGLRRRAPSPTAASPTSTATPCRSAAAAAAEHGCRHHGVRHQLG